MREAWIDRWKGLLILLVALGHAVGGGGNLAEGSASNLLLELWRVIYIFHMPAFFVLAGLCWKSSPRNSFCVDMRKFALKRVRRLIIPYVVFGVFSWVVYDAIFGKWGEIGIQMLRLLIATDDFRCNSVLWFLPAMFIVLLVAFVVDWLFSPSIKILCGIAVVDYIVFFMLRYNHVNELPFMIFPATKYYFCFLVGVIMKRVFREKCFKLSGTSIAVLLVSFAMVAFMFKYNTRPLGGFTLWMFLGIVGASLSAAVARILPDCGFKWLEWIGGMSMGIMLVHKFPLVAVQEHLPCVRAMFGKDVFIALLGVMLVFVVAVSVSIVTTCLLRRFVPWSIGERKNVLGK